MSFLRTGITLVLCCAELSISAVIHIVYAASILLSVVLADLLEFISAGFFQSILTRAYIQSFLKNSIVRALSLLDSSVNSSSGISTTIQDATVIENRSLSAAGHEDAPIVLVHGIFGFGEGKMGSLSYWAGAEKKDDRVLVPHLGPLTSIHDRACELFFFLKGGTVDYGIEHSVNYGHMRFGRTYYQGRYPEWDENHPVHFVGHSTGAQVVRVLQQMLADKRFEGFDNTNADWVFSLTSLSGVLNGSTRIYLDGISPEDGRTLMHLSLLQLLRIGVVIYEWLDIPILKRYYNFGFDHFDMSWKKIGLMGLIKNVLFEGGPFASGDWICPDLSIQSAVECNKYLHTFPNTFYFSYATRKTRKFLGFTVPSSIIGIHPLFYLRALQLCQWKHPSHVPHPYEGYRDEDWLDNDGALNTISMLFPRFPESHPHCWLGPDFKDGQSLCPGMWYYTLIEADHIFFIINRERAGVQFDYLYGSIFQRCRRHMKRALSQELSTDAGGTTCHPLDARFIL